MTININELRQSLGAVRPEEVDELLDRLEAAEKERDWNAERLEDAVEELTALRAELETERMRLAACGVVALSNTPDSAKQARDMLPEYWSASCGDVARMVDENISLRARIEAAENDAAHQKALAASALRVAEGWERKCDELRAKIEQMEKRLRLILEEPENTMSSSKALREMVRQARLALEESK